MPLVRNSLTIGNQRSCQPVLRARLDDAANRIEAAVLAKDMSLVLRQAVRRRSKGRVFVPDRAKNDKRVDFRAAGVRRSDQIRQRIKATLDGDEIRRRLARVEVPRVTAPPDLREDDIGTRSTDAIDHAPNVGVVVRSRIERVDPDGTEFAAKLSCVGR